MKRLSSIRRFFLFFIVFFYNSYVFSQNQFTNAEDTLTAEKEIWSDESERVIDLRSITPGTSVPNQISIDTSKGVGEIPINSGISSTGAKTYEIPIDVPKGMNNLQPSISLCYNSQQGNSIAGMGWAISGLSQISRGAKTPYYDGRSVAVQMDSTDVFFLDGIRLIKIGTETDYFLYESEQGHIKAKGYFSGNIIKYFEVFFPNGRRGVFGNTSNTVNQLFYPQTSLIDLFNNTITYNYTYAGAHYTISSIAYNGASIIFQYQNTRPDPIRMYWAGQEYVEQNLLKSITCKRGNTTVGTYTLSHTTTSSDRTLLSQVGFEADGNSLNPIRFYYKTYQGTPSSFTQSSSQLQQWHPSYNPYMIRALRGRFDYHSGADGVISVQNKNPYWEVSGTSHKYFENKYNHTDKIFVYNGFGGTYPELSCSLTVEKGFVDILCADLEGKMDEDIIRVNDSVIGSSDNLSFTVYRAEQPSSLNQRYTRTYQFPTVYQDGYGHKSIQPKSYLTGDFNGDGRMEVLAVSAHQPFNSTSLPSKCYIFALENNQILFQDNLFPYHRLFVGSTIDNDSIAENNSDKVFAMDYDGDGKTDLFYIGPTEMRIYTFDGLGSSLTARLIASSSILTRASLENRHLLIGDFNGDGLMDILVSPSSAGSSSTWVKYLSKGNGTFAYSTFDCFMNNPNYGGFMTQDINGDGRSDLVAYHVNGFDVLLAANDGFSLSSIYETTPNSFTTIIPASVNSGDRLTSLIGLKQNAITKYTYNHPLQHESVIVGMANSLGVIEKNCYEMMTDDNGTYSYDATSSNASFPYVSLHERIPLVSSTETRMNNNVVDRNTYAYENAIIHRQGLGFRGFEKLIHTNMREQVTTQCFDPTRFGVLTSLSTPTNLNTYEYSVAVQENKLADVRLTSKTETDLLTGVSATTTCSYDSYGYPTTETTTYSEGTVVSRQNTYTHYPTVDVGYHLGYQQRQYVTTTKGASSYVEQIYTPTNNAWHAPTNKYLYKDGHVAWRASYVYDVHGNITTESTKNYNSSSWQVYERAYDSYGQLTQETDPLECTTSYSYDNKGCLLYVTDPRGGITSYCYDAFGRESSVTRPDGTVKSTTRAWNSSITGGLFSVTTTETGKPTTKTYYDALGREIRTSDMRFDGYYRHVDKEYDNYGNLIKESYPFKGSSTTRYKAWNYDQYGRVIEDLYWQGMENTIEYNGLSITTTDNNNHATTRTYDVLGNLVSVTDEAGTTTYHIAPDGQPDSITAPGGVTTSFTYDVYRRRKSIIDPSAGTTSYAYDVSGNIIRETDSRGRSIRYNYDQHNRLTTTTRSEFTTTRTYNTYGDLTNVTSTNGTFKEMTYDSFGRLSTITDGTDNTWLQKSYYYSYGKVDSIQYSTSTGFHASENYVYANGHWVKGLLNGHITVYELKNENGLGLPTHVETLSVDRNYTYSESGLPTGRVMALRVVEDPHRQSAFNPTHVTFLNHSYHFDQATSNLTSRTDNLRNLTETFSYDNLYRLTSYGNATATYDAKGNMTSKSDVGSFSYSTPQKPYAISNAAFSATGIDTAEQDITYTSFHRPDSIIQGNVTTTFTYNDEGERMLMSTSKPVGNHISTTAKYYLGNCYEESGFSQYLYLFGDYYDSPVVLGKETYFDVYSMQYVTEEKLHYLLRDHLGSIMQVIGEDGTVEQNVSYDAWGRLRNPSTLQPYAAGSEPTLFLGRGYCGHEHLPQFGLINMNARLYDPALGRFLSPDPYVQMPDNTQSFNRYSYCLNNPLKYVDENGEFWHILIGALIGGVSNLATNWKNIDGFWQGFTAFVVGAGSGASVAATGGASIGVVAGVSAATAAGTAATNSVIAQTGKNFSGMNNVNWGSVGKNSVVGGVAGAAGGMAGYYASSASWLVNNINSPVARSVVAAPLAAGAGHIAGGTTYGLLEGQSFGTSFANSFEGLGSSMAIGGAIGVASTIGTCYAEGINPLNGKPLNNDVITAKDLHLESEVQRIIDGRSYNNDEYNFHHDGTRFYNNPHKQGYLPQGVQYMEYVVPTPGISGPGVQRIVVGNDGNWYYTPNHYDTFIKFIP